jgi:hypothetical protein
VWISGGLVKFVLISALQISADLDLGYWNLDPRPRSMILELGSWLHDPGSSIQDPGTKAKHEFDLPSLTTEVLCR